MDFKHMNFPQLLLQTHAHHLSANANMSVSTTAPTTHSTITTQSEPKSSIATTKEELRKELQNEISKLIKPYKHRRREPRFTPAELVVMAVVFHPEEGCTQLQIQRWITTNFRYYMDLALVNTQLDPGHLFAYGSRTTTRESMDFQAECTLAFRSFDVPLRRTQKLTDKPWAEVWAISTSAARTCLDDVLPKEDKEAKPFPFIRLPPELRNRIYEMSLVFPKPGVCVKVRKAGKGSRMKPLRMRALLLTVGRQEKRFDEVDWDDLNDAYGEDGKVNPHVAALANDEVILGPSPGKLLALLRVSKEVYAEAMPIFFGMNTFMFAEVAQLQYFLEATSPDRRKHISHVAVHYLASDATKANKAFSLLKNIPHLRELDVKVNEESLKAITKNKSSESKYPDFSMIPGVSHVAA